MLRNKRIRCLIIILTFFVLACVSDIFIIHTHVLFSTTDMPFHLKRVMELYSGDYLSSFSFNYFHGSAVMSMYPYFSLYPLLLLLHITSSYLYAYYYFFILIIFAVLLISFFSSLKFSKSEATSYLFAILYSLSIAFLINYFHDGDLGITTSFVFLPLAIFGILDVLNGSGGYIKLSLGLTFMAFCQLPTTIITGLFIILLILININEINKLIFYNLLKSAILTILLTSIVWIPFLKIILFNKITTPTSSQIQSANIVSIIKNVGLLPILSIFALPFYFKRFSRYVKQMYCLSVVIIIVASSYVPLIRLIASIKLFHFINTFQFTARFLIIPQVILCYLASWLIVKWISHFNKFKFSFVGIIILILLSQFVVQMFVVHNEFNQKYLYADSYQSIRMFSPVAGHYMIKKPWMKYLLNGYMNNSDYYPAKSIPKQKYIVNNEATYGHDQTINVKHTGYNRFSFNSSKKINRLVLPLLHYNDEHLRVYVNHHLVRYHVNKNSLITLSNVKKGRSVVSVRSVPSVQIILIKLILFLSGIIWLISILLNRTIQILDNSKYLGYLSYLQQLYNKLLKKKYFCFISSLLISLLIILFIIHDRSFTNIKIVFVDIIVMLIPYCVILDVIIHINRINKIDIKKDKIVKYFIVFLNNFAIRYQGMISLRFKIVMISVIFVCSIVYEIFVSCMIKMSLIIVNLNRINKHIREKSLSQLNDAYAIYFMSWMILGLVLIFILSIIYYKNIRKGFINLWSKVIVSITSIIGVMLTALSTVQQGAYTQTISYNFSVMLVYLMTPICIILIDFIHIHKMRKQYKENLYHKHLNNLLSVNKEMYNSQYHYTR